jgi:hypothetical protein
VREKPPEAPQMPSIDLRAMQLPLAEIGGFLVGMAKVAGLVLAYTFLLIDPILVAKIDGTYWEIATWYETY